MLVTETVITTAGLMLKVTELVMLVTEMVLSVTEKEMMVTDKGMLVTGLVIVYRWIMRDVAAQKSICNATMYTQSGMNNG